MVQGFAGNGAKLKHQEHFNLYFVLFRYFVDHISYSSSIIICPRNFYKSAKRQVIIMGGFFSSFLVFVLMPSTTKSLLMMSHYILFVSLSFIAGKLFEFFSTAPQPLAVVNRG
jgi:hypothetical protein